MANWIKGAIKNPGALHRDLGVPQGQKIPRDKLEAAARGGGKTAQRARLAKTLAGFADGGVVKNLPAVAQQRFRGQCRGQ